METPREPLSFPGAGEEPPEPPEMPKFLTRRSAVVMVIGFGVLALLALTRGGSSPANLSAKGVGPLKIGKATRTQMQRFARGPIDFWLNQKGDVPFRFKGQLWQYDCVGGAKVFGLTCRTFYGITNGHVATIETTSPQFFTAAETRMGTPLAQARKREHAQWSGWSTKCPHLILPAPKGVTFFASVARDATLPKGFVSGFYLSATPSSFDYCVS
jgi:hypothetical protein